MRESTLWKFVDRFIVFDINSDPPKNSLYAWLTLLTHCKIVCLESLDGASVMIGK